MSKVFELLYWCNPDDYIGLFLTSSLGFVPFSLSKQIFSTELKYLIAGQRLLLSKKST